MDGTVHTIKDKDVLEDNKAHFLKDKVPSFANRELEEMTPVHFVLVSGKRVENVVRWTRWRLLPAPRRRWTSPVSEGNKTNVYG